MDLKLDGKVALVMGASKGIGLGCAMELAKEGCQVIITSRSEANLKKAAIKIKTETGSESEIVVCNMSNVDDIYELIKKVIGAHGKIDILINNTGGPKPGGFFDVSEEDWILSFEKMLLGTVRLYKKVIPIMKENNFGRIINITSMSVKQPIPELILSNSIRPGVIGLTKTVSDEIAEYNITINNIAPGHIKTERQNELINKISKKTGKTVEEIFDDFKKVSPMNKVGKPYDIGSMVAFLASEKASFITGTTISVDGGNIRGLF